MTRLTLHDCQPAAGLLDPSALNPGPDFWKRPGKSPGAIQRPPEDWAPEKPQEMVSRWAKIRSSIRHAMDGVGEAGDRESWKRFISKVSVRPPVITICGRITLDSTPSCYHHMWTYNPRFYSLLLSPYVDV